MELIVELVVALVVAFVTALAKLATTRRPESLLATFVKARLRTNATNMRTHRHSCVAGCPRCQGERPVLW
jgi:hypothetical protein